jgi:excisionase family DNA binding protein
MAEEGLVDADVIAEYLNIPRKDVLKLARMGLIPAIRLTRKLIRFNRAKVRAALDQLEG